MGKKIVALLLIIFGLTTITAMASESTAFKAAYSYRGSLVPREVSGRYEGKWREFSNGLCTDDTEIKLILSMDFELGDQCDVASFEEFLQSREWNLSNFKKNILTADPKFDTEQLKVIEVYYSLQYNQLGIFLSEPAKDLLTDKQIAEITSYFTDETVETNTRMFNGLAAFCAKVYEGKDYEKNETTEQLLADFALLDPSYGKTPVVYYVLAVTGLLAVAAAVVFWCKRKKTR